MAQPIVVGYDPETSDRAPVRFGAFLARCTGAPLIVACVESGPRPLVLSAGQSLTYALGHVDEGLPADCSQALRGVESELEHEGVAVEVRKLLGTSAARALHEAAEAERAGLLVVGSTDRGPVGRVLPGSTAERLVHGAPCPLAVVPQGWDAGEVIEAIGVGFVDSEEGREALRGAYALARRAGATLRVLTVVKPRLTMLAETEPPRFMREGRDIEDVEGQHLLEAREAARRAVAELADGVPVEVEALVDDPADALIAVSRHLDLLVCGSRGYGPMRAVLLGGVSRRVANEAHCPVIVLPRGVEATLEALLAEAPGAAAV
jgi:nucleotide-binding universal stress UspA family protein